MRYSADPPYPPYPPFERGVGGISGETSKVPLFKGDFGGSKCLA
jgi:hypothetical protein